MAADAPAAAAFLRTQTAWEPFAFVDLCAASLVGRAPCAELCRHIQKHEWELLFDWCYRHAIGLSGGREPPEANPKGLTPPAQDQ